MGVIDTRETIEGETGYPLLSFSGGRTWIVRLIVTLLGSSIGVTLLVWYIRYSNDASPDSIAGYAFAIVGTIFLILSAVLYSLHRRSHKKRVVGRLNASLQWHICFAVSGLVFLFLHSFGNFNPRSGTYALYGLIALVISGFVGRILDRILPRFIAREVNKALTGQGEDRIETISQKLQAIVVYNNEDLHSFNPGSEVKPRKSPTSLVPLHGPISNDFPFEFKNQPLHTPWDLAYISLEATPQELSRETGEYRFIPDKKSALTRPGALMPGAQEQISELQEVERAMQREQFYRYIIRYWRKFHVALALLTLGLILWHLIYAAQLLIPTLIPR